MVPNFGNSLACARAKYDLSEAEEGRSRPANVAPAFHPRYSKGCTSIRPLMTNKLTGPGLFRLFLALLVFFNHASRFQIGNGAVFVFFCLSGYWICRMYRGRYAGTRQPYLTYLVSRAWRLLPTFLLLTVIALLFLWVHGNLADYWAKSNHLHFVLSNLFILGYQSLPMKPLVPAWSLD